MFLEQRTLHQYLCHSSMEIKNITLGFFIPNRSLIMQFQNSIQVFGFITFDQSVVLRKRRKFRSFAFTVHSGQNHWNTKTVLKSWIESYTNFLIEKSLIVVFLSIKSTMNWKVVKCVCNQLKHPCRKDLKTVKWVTLVIFLWDPPHPMEIVT